MSLLSLLTEAIEAKLVVREKSGPGDAVLPTTDRGVTIPDWLISRFIPDILWIDPVRCNPTNGPSLSYESDRDVWFDDDEAVLVIPGLSVEVVLPKDPVLRNPGV